MTYGLGHIELCLGDYSAAQELFLPALVLAKEMGNFRALAGGLWELGIVELLEGDFDKANQTCQESLRIGRTSYAQDQLAMILSVSAMASLLNGHLSQAEAFDREALQIIIETRSTFMMPYVWPAIVMLLTEQGKVEWALELQAMAAEHFPFVARAKYIDVLVGERLREAAAALPAGVAEIAQEHGRKRDLWATSREVLTGLGN